MKEDDMLKEIFERAELNYSVDGIEEVVLRNIELKRSYVNRKRPYELMGQIGMILLFLLCLLFLWVVESDDVLYLFFGAPFILLALMFPLEKLFIEKFAKIR